MFVQIGYAILIVIGVLALIYSSKKIKDTYDVLRSKVANVVGGEEKLRQYEDAIMKAVMAVEQASMNEYMTSDEKKKMAMELAPSFIELAGLDKIDDSILGAIIEAGVFVLNLTLKGNIEKKEKKAEEDVKN